MKPLRYRGSEQEHTQACTILGGDKRHRTPTADAESAKCTSTGTEVHLYVSTPQGKWTLETHAQIPTAISTNQLEPYFETAASSVQQDERAEGAETLLADVQLESTKVIEDRRSNIANDLPQRQQA